MKKYSVSIITVSDRCSRGERDDLSGPAIEKWAVDAGYLVMDKVIVPDEQALISETIIGFCDKGAEMVLTTGGTGFAPRDRTPEATREVLDRIAPGIAETMRWRSLQITDKAMLSRAVAGIRGTTLIINLPGSPKSVRENLGFIEKALPHALELLASGVSDCGSV